MQQCTNELEAEFWEAIAASLKIQNIKNEVKKGKKNIGKTWNNKFRKRCDIFWRYYRNKRLNQLFREELEKENPIVSRRFQIKQREHEVEEGCKIQKEFVKE